MKFLINSIHFFNALPEFADKKVISCTTQEVDFLSKKIPEEYVLPLAYCEFLLFAGHKFGGIFGGVDFSFGMANVLIDDDYNFIKKMVSRYSTQDIFLPKDIFVINEHSGGSMLYILLSEGDNPPVYFWEEGDKLSEAVVDAPSFSEFVKKEIVSYQNHIT